MLITSAAALAQTATAHKPAHTTEAAATLTADERIFGLAKIWSEVKYNYPMWHRVGTLDWDAEFRRVIPEVSADQSDWRYYRRLQRFAALVQDGHVSVYPPKRLRAAHKRWPPVRLWPIDGQPVVIRCAEGLDPDGRLRLGDAIIAVDAMPSDQYAAVHARPYFAASTEQSKTLGATTNLLAGPADSTVEVTLRKPNGSTGNPLMFDLPGGGRFRVCTRYMLLPDGTEFIGIGIPPDIEVKATAQDIAAGRDSVLTRAMDEIKAQRWRP